MNMITNFESRSLGNTASNEKAVKDLLANEAQFGASHGMEDDCKENQGHQEGNFRRMKKTGESDKNCMQCSIKETSLRHGTRTSNVVYGNIQSDGLSKSCEKCKMLTQKVALTDKLWDGRLLLNSSVTVSAVAFFMSGEKMPGIKWSESIEVKGKVKLDDFVKYIQDLPRSRNRGLMVVSLRWKQGSSRLALAGMKKVAKRYQECERVGLAQLSPGIVLYVCPHTETIITILAKYGFFKGKTVTDENKDSMVGCIVWRRNQINLNPVEGKSERCTHQVASQWSPIHSQLSDQVAAVQWSPIHLPLSDQVDAVEWSPIRWPLESLELSGKNCADLDANQKDRIKTDKSMRNSPLGVHNFPTSYNALTSQSTPSTLPSVHAGPEKSHPDPEYQQASMEQSLKLNSGRCTPQVAAVEWSPIHWHSESLASSGKNRTALDRGDLPEFDFGTSSGTISQAVIHRALDSLPVDKNLPDKGFGHMDGSLPQKAPTLNPWPTSHKRRLEDLSHQGLSSDDDNTQKMPPQKKVCRDDNISMLPLVGDRQSSDMRKPYGTPVAPPAKNPFANNDHMAKWAPPDFNQKMQSIHPVHSSNFPIDPKEQKLAHPVQYAPAQNPNFSSPYVAANRPPFPIQTPHFGFHPFRGPVFTGEHAQPRPSAIYNAMAPSSMQINSFQPVRSGSCLVNGKMPINHEGWKGWNPYMPNRNGV